MRRRRWLAPCDVCQAFVQKAGGFDGDVLTPSSSRQPRRIRYKGDSPATMLLQDVNEAARLRCDLIDYLDHLTRALQDAVELQLP